MVKRRTEVDARGEREEREGRAVFERAERGALDVVHDDVEVRGAFVFVLIIFVFIVIVIIVLLFLLVRFLDLRSVLLRTATLAHLRRNHIVAIFAALPRACITRC